MRGPARRPPAASPTRLGPVWCPAVFRADPALPTVPAEACPDGRLFLALAEPGGLAVRGHRIGT